MKNPTTILTSTTLLSIYDNFYFYFWVQAPTDGYVVPTAVISGPNRVGECTDVNYRGDYSLGVVGPGKGLAYQWSISILPNEIYTTSNIFLSEEIIMNFIVNQTTIDSNYALTQFNVNLTVTNWKNLSDTTR